MSKWNAFLSPKVSFKFLLHFLWWNGQRIFLLRKLNNCSSELELYYFIINIFFAHEPWNIFSTREEKFCISKRPCNVLFIIQTPMTDCRFQCRCRSLGCLQLQRHSQKPFPAPPPDFQYPMNSPHYYSRYRKYFLHFGSLSPFLNFLFLTKPLSIPNSSSPSRNVFSARGLVTSLLWGSDTYSTSSAMFVTEIVRLFRSNCPLRVRKEYLCTRPYYAPG